MHFIFECGLEFLVLILPFPRVGDHRCVSPCAGVLCRRDKQLREGEPYVAYTRGYISSSRTVKGRLKART